MNIKTKT